MLVLTFRNTSDLAPTSNYEYEVWVTTTEGKKHVIKSGVVLGHKRANGWQKLVKRILKEQHK